MRLLALFLLVPSLCFGASGDPMPILRVGLPATSAPDFNFDTGASSPAESVPVWALDAAADEFVDIYFLVFGYDGLGLEVELLWIADTAATGSVVWQCAVRRRDSADDLDSAHTYVYNTVTTAAPTTSAGQPASSTITFTDGADQDSIVDTERGIMRCGRDADNGSDDMAGDAFLVGFSVREQ